MTQQREGTKLVENQPRTVACQIGKHKLCNGTGTHEDTGKRMACGCYCHGLREEQE